MVARGERAADDERSVVRGTEVRSLKEGRSEGQSPAGTSTTREPPRRGVVASTSPEELDALLVGHCQHATTALTPGSSGVRWAAKILASLPEGCRRRLPDVTATGPRVFSFLVEQGLLPAMPSPRLVPTALALVAEVSPMLQARSRRSWTLWFARVRDADSPIAAAIRKQTPRSQLGLTVPPPSRPPLRSTVLRAERDRLEAELVAAKSEIRSNVRSAHQVLDLLAATRHELADAQRLVRTLREKLAARSSMARSLLRELDARWIELGEADAELELRRGPRVPTATEVEKARKAIATRLRDLQGKRRPLFEDDEDDSVG